MVAKAVNPKGLAPYKGPTGTVSGTVRVKGDPPPAPKLGADIEPGCDKARAVVASPYRLGPDDVLIDGLVAVTNYEGFVPATQPKVLVTGDGCSWGTQTIAMTFGQQLEVKSADQRSYIPELVPARLGVVYVAAPGRDAVVLTPEKPQSYRLVDRAHPYSSASVFVLNYATHSVTNQAGQFEIKGIPVGRVKVNALLPPTMEATSQSVEVKAGEVTQVELTIQHRAEAPGAAPSSSAAPSGDAAPSAAPSSSAAP